MNIYLKKFIFNYPVLFILLLLLIIFFPVLFLNKALFYRDITNLEMPLSFYTVNSFKNLEIPLWNPYIFSGIPNTGLQPPIFYPSILFFLIFPYHIALGLLLVIHLFFAGLGVYKICRYWDIGKTGSLIGGMIFSLNGCMLNISDTYYMLFSISWIPFIFLYSEKLIHEGKIKNFISLVIFSSLQLATGRLDYFYFTQMLIWSWVLLNYLGSGNLRNFKPLVKKTTLLFSAFLISFAALFVQILPSIELLKTTERRDGVTLEYATFSSLHPLQLINLAFNNFFGNPFYNNGISQLLRSSEKDHVLLIYNLYVGLISITFLFYSFYKFKTNKKVIYLSTLFFLFFLIALGRHSFIFNLFYNYLPGFNAARYSIKLFIISIFSTCLLIAIGLDNFLKFENKKTLAKIILFIFTFISLFTIILVLFKSNLINYLNETINAKITNLDFIFSSIFTTFGFYFVFIILFLCFYFDKITKQKFKILLLLLIGLDFVNINQKNLWVADSNILEHKPQILKDIETISDDKRLYYIFRHLDSKVITSNSLEALTDLKSKIDTMYYNLNIIYQINDSYGGYPAFPYKQNILSDILNNEKIPNKNKVLFMRIMGIRFYIWHLLNQGLYTPPDTDNFKLLKTYNDSFIQLWEIKNYQSRFTFRTKAIVTDSEKTLLDALLNPQLYNFKNDMVFLLKDDNYEKAFSLIKKSNSDNINVSEVKLLEETNNTLLIDVNVKESGYLVIASNYYEGWTATDNSSDTPLLKANFYQNAVRLGSGKHSIRLIYKPRSFLIGSIVSLTTLFLFLLVSFIYLITLNKSYKPIE
jgi:hypothetical protein